jgi:hypothetical protein
MHTSIGLRVYVESQRSQSLGMHQSQSRMVNRAPSSTGLVHIYSEYVQKAKGLMMFVQGYRLKGIAIDVYS